MSERTRMRAAVMLNWRGVTYQRYELDPFVTALEGPNGAGKTTTMIAVYVALLPDLRLLRFGDAAGPKDGDRGIHGRLGGSGPAYSVLDFVLPGGERLLAGVLLRAKQAPKVELKPFIVTDLANDLLLEEVLLVREDEGAGRIPELAELRTAAARHGGQLQSFDSVGEYLTQLFERGVTPLRMAHSSERSRMHQLLHTSMYGGISRTIQQSLRDYLLSADNKLRTHVARMREVLEVCRRTRQELEASRARYETIERVYEAGQGMFAAGYHAARVERRELRVRADRDRAAYREARERRQASEERLEVLKAAHEAAAVAAELAEQAHEGARARLLAMEAAVKLSRELTALRPALAEAGEALAEAIERHGETEAERQAAAGRRDAAVARQIEIGRELADAQRRWEQIIARVERYRAARRALEEAQALCPGLTAETVSAETERAESAWRAAESALAQMLQQLEALVSRRARFAAGAEALDRMTATLDLSLEGPPGPRAMAAEAAAVELARRVELGADLPARIAAATERARRQKEVSSKLAELPEAEAWTAAAVAEAFAEAQQAQRALDEALSQSRASLADARAERRGARERLQRLREDLAHWQRADAVRRGLESAHGVSLADQEALAGLRRTLRSERRAAELRRDTLEIEEARLAGEIEALEAAGGRLDPRLRVLRDLVQGSIVAEAFDDVEVENAATIEATLGPLAGAILVEDVERAATRIAQVDDRPDTVWLVQGDEALPEQQGLGDSVLAAQGDAWRLTRLPERPVVGRAARDRELERLAEAAQALVGELSALRTRLAALEAAEAATAAAAEHAAWWGRRDPAPAVAEAEAAERAAAAQIRAAEAAIERDAAERAPLAKRRQVLSWALPHARLLDLEDQAAEAERLRAERQVVQAARGGLQRAAKDRRVVTEHLGELLHPPPDEAAEAELRLQAEALQATQTKAHLLRRRLQALTEGVLADLAHADAEQLLEAGAGAPEALEQELEAVTLALETARAAITRLEASLESARRKRDRCARQREELEARVSRLAGELEASELVPSEEALADALTAFHAAERSLDTQRMEAQRLESERIRLEATLAATAGELKEKRGAWREDLIALRPVHSAWVALRRGAREAELLGPVEAPQTARRFTELGHVLAYQEAASRFGELRRRLVDAEHGEAIAEEVAALVEVDGPRQALYFDTWHAVRTWLQTIIPRDIVQADDPLTAMASLRQHLENLESRLGRQERDLRQRTDTIANGIRTRIRRERGHVRELNRDLEEAAFGSIRAIRIRLEVLDQMERLLTALQSQPELFNQDEPLEDVMARLYREVGGGRVRGEQLLDYREYLHLTVEVQRQGSDRWEPARPQALSTGEAIGVGAAILIVILASWEREASAWRERRLNESMRFLFLDEATRLSADSLATLIEFCERLKLQLLIAAPEVARARHGVTYKLTRCFDGEQERVVVRGRRGFA